MIRSMLFVGALACAFVAPIAVNAAPVTFYFTGVVEAVAPMLATEFSVLESVVGSYTFESTTMDSDPSDPTSGIYDNAISAITVTFGGDYTVTEGSDNAIFSGNDAPNDAYAVFLTNPTAPTIAGLNLGVLFFGIVDTDATGFTSDALLLIPPSFSEFENFSSGAIFLGNPNQSVNFRLTSLTLIPEPATLVLLGMGLIGLAMTARRRS